MVKMNELQIAVSPEIMELMQHFTSDEPLEIKGLDCNRGKEIKLLCFRDSNGETTLSIDDSCGLVTSETESAVPIVAGENDGDIDGDLVPYSLTESHDGLGIAIATGASVAMTTVEENYDRGDDQIEFMNHHDDDAYDDLVSGMGAELVYNATEGIELETVLAAMDNPGGTKVITDLQQQRRYGAREFTDDITGISVFCCYRCPQQFPKLQTLKGHMKCCHGEGLDESKLQMEMVERGSVCRICRYVATTTEAMRSHMTRKHRLFFEQQHRELKTDARRLMWGRRRLEKQKTFPKIPCLICGTDISLLKNYSAHIKRLHRKDPLFAQALQHVEEIRFSRESKSSTVHLSCPICNNTLDGARILQHMRWVHFGDPNVQNALQNTRTLLLQEKKKVQTLELQKFTECSQCGRRLRKVSLQNHVKFYCSSKKRPLADLSMSDATVVPRDGGLGSDKSSHRGGMMGKQTVTCEICNKRIAFVKYSRHRRMMHKVSVNKPVDSLLCNYCSKTYTEPHQLKAHLRKHTKDNLMICLLCHKWFCDEYVYNEHFRRVHCSKFRFNCDCCCRGFWKRRTYDVHVCNPSDLERNRERKAIQMKKMELLMKLDRPLFVRVNTNEENDLPEASSIVLCLLCKKSFTSKVSFNFHHEVVHLALYRYSCSYCGRNFVRKEQEIRHKCLPENFATNVQKHMAQKQTALAERKNYFGPSSVTIEFRKDIAEIMGEELSLPQSDVYSDVEERTKEPSDMLSKTDMVSNEQSFEEDGTNDKSCTDPGKDIHEKISLTSDGH